MGKLRQTAYHRYRYLEIPERLFQIWIFLGMYHLCDILTVLLDYLALVDVNMDVCFAKLETKARIGFIQNRINCNNKLKHLN